MSLLRRTMDEDTFWELIAVMGGGTDDEAVERLTEALGARGKKAARPFAERLARALYELDREVLFRQPVRFADEDPAELADPEVEALGMSDDGFLYLRAGIVARGREVYRQVLADPTELSRGTWEECEELLYVADELADDDIETKVSYETGSNSAHWSEAPPEPEREAWDVGPRAVVVDVRDLSQPYEGAAVLPDGTLEPRVDYLEARWLDRNLTYDLTVAASRAVTLGGGLPEGCGERIEVRLDLGEGWRLDPEDEGLVPDRLVGEPVRRVSVVLDTATVRGWEGPVRQEAMLGVTAAAVLVVLPADHGGRTALQGIADAGAHHLPG